MKCNQESHRSLFLQHALAALLSTPVQRGLDSME
jgi:hypothetical protein